MGLDWEGVHTDMVKLCSLVVKYANLAVAEMAAECSKDRSKIYNTSTSNFYDGYTSNVFNNNPKT